MDPKHQIEILSLFRSISKNGNIVIAALHDLNLAALFADQLVLISNGKIKAAGTLRQVLSPENIFSVYNFKCHVDAHSQGNLVIAPDVNGESSLAMESRAELSALGQN